MLINNLFNRIYSNKTFLITINKIIPTQIIMNEELTTRYGALILRLEKAKTQAKQIQNEINEVITEIDEIFKRCKSTNLTQTNEIHFTNAKRSNSSSDDDSEIARKKVKSDFEMDNDFVIVYTDGACENNGRGNAKAGLGVWFGENHPLNVGKPVDGKATNNTAEIQACVEALKIAKSNKIEKIKIKTDSKFTINCITQWVLKWKKNNWRLANGGDVKNKIDLKKLDELRDTFVDVKWEYVAGHQGIRGNEEADRLARQGASSYQS